VPLCSLDAIHLASARELAVTDLVTYDGRMGAAAMGLGFRVRAPGSQDDEHHEAE
jgi:predicted nucleic acid-binding protein